MHHSLIIAIRLVPILMQLLGIAGLIFGGWYSMAMIMGAGIGSPNGTPHDSYYAAAGWMVGVPAAIFLIGWIWVIVGFLFAPSRGQLRPEMRKGAADQAGMGGE